VTAVQGFKTKLIFQDLDGSDWLVMAPLTYEAADSAIYTIPAGFITDLASIPRFFWRVYPRSGPWNEAAVLHDWLYNQQTVTRLRADELFREGMLWLGVSPTTARNMYLGCRIGGWKPWAEHANRTERQAA
jgi:hypothetical protein